MMTDSNTSWRNVWAIQAMIPSPPGLSAAGRPMKAIIAKTYAHHIDPTTLVKKTASLALIPSALWISVFRLRRLIASLMWWRVRTASGIRKSFISGSFRPVSPRMTQARSFHGYTVRDAADVPFGAYGPEMSGASAGGRVIQSRPPALQLRARRCRTCAHRRSSRPARYDVGRTRPSPVLGAQREVATRTALGAGLQLLRDPLGTQPLLRRCQLRPSSGDGRSGRLIASPLLGRGARRGTGERAETLEVSLNVVSVHLILLRWLRPKRRNRAISVSTTFERKAVLRTVLPAPCTPIDSSRSPSGVRRRPRARTSRRGSAKRAAGFAMQFVICSIASATAVFASRRCCSRSTARVERRAK